MASGAAGGVVEGVDRGSGVLSGNTVRSDGRSLPSVWVSCAWAWAWRHERHLPVSAGEVGDYELAMPALRQLHRPHDYRGAVNQKPEKRPK